MQKIDFILREDAGNLNGALMKLGISHRTFRSYYYKDLIRVDGKEVRMKDRVKAGSVISFTVPDEELPKAHEVPCGAEVIYEDEGLIVFNKPAGLLTHETRVFDGITFRDYAAQTFREKGIAHPVRFINRLDMDTSGLILVAKNDLTQGYYSKLHNEYTKKEYIAIAKGELTKKTKVDLPIARDEIGIKRKVGTDGEEALDALSVFTPLMIKNGHTILKAEIKTGRTHQIRVHLLSLGLTIVGDALYGEESELINRQALHSYRLRTSGFNQKRLDIFCEMPDDMKKLIREIF